MTSLGVVVYDGDCGLCEASAKWIERHIAHVETVTHYAYGVEQLGSVWFVTPTRVYEGSHAVGHILTLSATRWIRLAGHIINAPVMRLVAHGVYRIIARYRRHVSRVLGMKACALPAPKS